MTYHRIARHQKQKGHIFVPTGSLPLERETPEIEETLERNRPKHCLRRDNCVYMREDRDFSRMGLSYDEGYVHQVEATELVEQRDVTWIGYLQLLLNQNPQIRAVSEAQRNSRHGLTNDELAQRYWHGILSPTPHLEYVTSRAKVVQVDCFLSPVKP